LQTLLRAELRAVADQPVRVFLPPARARRLIRDLPPEALSAKALAEIVTVVRRNLEKRLRTTRRSPAQILGADVAARIERVFDEDMFAGGGGEELVTTVLRQEFVRKLLTEVVHTSIVSFYKRVNPLFGGLATSMLEDQIRNFISMFMPMIQEQAVRFAVGKRSQTFARDLARTLAQHALETPVAEQVPALDTRQRKRVEQIIRDTAGDPVVRRHGHEITALVWDTLYEAIRDRKVRDLVDLEQWAPALADGGAELLAEILARPGLAAILRRELGTDSGSGATTAAPPSSRRRKA